MIKIGVADYGMCVWDGGIFDYEERILDLKKIGYDGIERMHPLTEADAINKASMLRRYSMDCATCLAPDIEHSIQWSAALGKNYVWVNVTANTFDEYCRQVNLQAKACEKWGIKVACHNHLGSLVETQEQLLAFLKACPTCCMVLDTGHLSVAENGDPLYIVENYFERIVAVHLKDWIMTDEKAEKWHEKGYFCGLGKGNFPINNDKIVEALIKKGYSKWILVEHDTHKQEPLIDLSESREYLKKCGI